MVGTFDVGERQLYLYCVGSGSPTVIFESSAGSDHTESASLQASVGEHTRACTYDRANIGDSDAAPAPRTTGDAVDDLRELLQSAGIDGRYVLVGTSAGASVVRTERAYPLLAASMIEGEEAYSAARTGSCWTTSPATPSTAPCVPDGVELQLPHSTIAQCEGDTTGPCPITADFYVELGAEETAEWPLGHFEAVDLPHDIFHVNESGILAHIKALIGVG